MSYSKTLDKEVLKIGPDTEIFLENFRSIVYGDTTIELSLEGKERLIETRDFINYLLEKNIKVYGLTTGFADLRNYVISPENASQLSQNIILSHDAGIGAPLPDDVVLGSMVLRAHSLAQGNSGFQVQSLQTLIEMINHRIIPQIPETGSLGASGDLAFLARLGRAMEGHDVPVSYCGKIMPAKAALENAGITPFYPGAKEGLALTNGTSFMASMIAIAYIRQIEAFENILAYQALFLNAIHSIDAAFNQPIQNVRKQKGQSIIAAILFESFENSPFINRDGIQNDYCIRCLPQLFGPRYETILEQYPKIHRELNAVTDNPLIFRREEISSDVSEERIINYKGDRWCVLSGGNFHGEYLASIADSLLAVNAKLALTLERQISYLLNPSRNKDILPIYLLQDITKLGLHSSYMIPQYTANALAQKIAHLAVPSSMFNITSANEAEDVVSYGASVSLKLLEQINYLEQFNCIYLTVVSQAYAIARSKYEKLPKMLISEKLFSAIQSESGSLYPTKGEDGFEKRYQISSEILSKGLLRGIIDYPLFRNLTPHHHQS